MKHRRTSESLFLSAVINSGGDPSMYGITDEMFASYSGEFRWIVSYPSIYGHLPSVEALAHQFPDFPYVADINDMQYTAEEVRQAHVRRCLVRVLQATGDYIEQGDLEAALMSYHSFEPPVLSSKPMMDELQDVTFIDDYEQTEETLDVPWTTLQHHTGGMREGDLWYLAARLSQGKSWTLGAFARDALMAGKTVKIYSLEMPRYQVKVRMHVLLGAALGIDVNHTEMRDRTFDQQQYKNLIKQISEQVSGSLYIHDSSMGRVTPMTVAQDKVDLAIVDYTGLMSTPVGGRAIDDWRSMGVISNMLKEVALTKGMRILAAAQINREGDTAGANPPKVKNLAQSDSLGQDADVVITHKQMSRSVMVYGIEKNRHGTSGDKFYTRFLPNHGRFNEIDKDRAEDIRDDELDD